MSVHDPPEFYSSIFNTEAYKNEAGFITLEYANRTYLKMAGGNIFGSLNIGGSLTTAGTVFFSNTTASTNTTTGALIVAGGVGISGNLNLGGLLSLTGNNDLIRLTNTITTGRTTISLIGNAINWEIGSRNSANTSNANNFYIYGNGGFRFLIDPLGNVNIVNHNGSTTGLKLGNILVTATATELNILDGVTASTSEINYLDLTTGPGFAEPNKALVLNSLGNIEGINILKTNELIALTGLTVEGGHLTMSASSHIKINSVSDATNMTDASIYSKGGIYIEKSFIALQNITSNRIALNGATTYPTVLHCGSTAGDRIIGVFNNTGNFYGFGAANSELKIQSGTTTGFGFYTSCSNSDLGAKQMAITSTSTSIFQTTASTSTTTGSLIVSGGVGISGAVNIGSTLNVLNPVSITPATKVIGGITVNGVIWHSNQSRSFGMRQADSENIALCWSGGGTYSDRVIFSNTNGTTFNTRVTITNTTASTSPTTGALVISGGIGCGGDIEMGVDKRVWLNGSFGFSHSNTAGGTAEIFSYSDGIDNNGFGTFSNNNFYITTNSIARLEFSKSGPITSFNTLNISNSTPSTSTITGALIVSGGVGISGDVNMNKLTTDICYIGTTISGANASSVFKKLNLQSLANNFGVLSIRGGNNDSPFFGSTDSILYCESSNLTNPISFELNVSKLTSATSTNALRFGTISNNDFVLFTNGTERMRITAGGNMTATGNISANGTLMVGGSTDTTRFISALDGTMGTSTTKFLAFGRANTDGNQVQLGFSYIGSNNDSNSLTFGFRGAERCRLTKWGSFLIGTTIDTYGTYKTRLGVSCTASTEWGAVFQNNSNSNNKVIAFYDVFDAEKGSITFGTGTTSFNTTSDYRLKKDIIPIMDGLEQVINLKPVRFKWKDTNMDAEGFIAHELQEINPYCVVGVKDAVYENGSINPQSVDYGKLTPILVNAVQQLYNKVKELENELNKKI